MMSRLLSKFQADREERARAKGPEPSPEASEEQVNETHRILGILYDFVQEIQLPWQSLSSVTAAYMRIERARQTYWRLGDPGNFKLAGVEMVAHGLGPEYVVLKLKEPKHALPEDLEDPPKGMEE